MIGKIVGVLWYFILRLFGIYHVKYYGAKCDGVTDDTAAVQRAIDAVWPGGVVYFPVGVCRITAPINASKSQVTYRGAAMRSIVRNDGTGNAFEINGTYATMYARIGFENLRVEGNPNSGLGLKGTYISTKLTIRDCEFSSHGDAGLYLASCWSLNIYNTNFSNNCQKTDASGVGTATKKAGLWFDYVNNFVIDGCHLVNNQNGSDGIRLNFCWSGTIRDPQLEDNSRYGGIIQSCRGVDVISPYVENNGPSTHGLWITGTVTDYSKSVSVIGGIVNGTNKVDYGISVSFAEGTEIHGVWGIRHNFSTVHTSTTAIDTKVSNITTSNDPADISPDPKPLDDLGVNTLYTQGRTNNYERTGSATVAATTTSIVVDHTLPSAPTFVSVSAEVAGLGEIICSEYTATQFTITVTNAPLTDAKINWYARR